MAADAPEFPQAIARAAVLLRDESKSECAMTGGAPHSSGAVLLMQRLAGPWIARLLHDSNDT